jgi:hypothetical protein
MKITRQKDKFFNTWEEGGRVHTQDVRTGKTSSMSRGLARRRLRDTTDMKAARKYANKKR